MSDWTFLDWCAVALMNVMVVRWWWVEHRLRVLGEVAWRLKNELEARGVRVEAGDGN